MQKICSRSLLAALFFLCFSGRNAPCDEGRPLALEPIVVTKSAFHLYFSDDIETRSVLIDSVAGVLSLAPIDLQSRGTSQSDFSLRGSNFESVLVLIDGKRANDPQTGHHNSDIPFTVLDFEKIEVAPGVSPRLLGPGVLSGAIDFRLKKPKNDEIIAQFEVGQRRSMKELFSISSQKDNQALRFSFENEDSAGFRYGMDYDNFTSSAGYYSIWPESEFSLNLGYQEKEFGAYDFYTPGMGYPSKEATKTLLVKTEALIEVEGFLLKPDFLCRRHYDKFILDRTGERSSYLNHHRTDVFRPGIYLSQEIPAGQLGLGFGYGWEEIHSSNLGKRQRCERSIFVDGNLDKIFNVALSGSCRFSDYDSFDSIFTAAFTLRKRLSLNNSVHAAAARSFRIPSFTELYYDDPTTTGNAGLGVERSMTYEAGYDYVQERFSSGLTLFIKEEADIIDWVKRIAAQPKWQVENIPDAEVCGIENYWKLKINERLNFESNYSWIFKHTQSQDYIYKYGPNYARYLLNNRLSFSCSSLTHEIGLTYKQKKFRDGWFLLNSKSIYQIKKNCRIFLNIKNILNVEYQEIAGVPSAGREIMTGMSFNW